jgi:hypothetical protein
MVLILPAFGMPETPDSQLRVLWLAALSDFEARYEAVVVFSGCVAALLL